VANRAGSRRWRSKSDARHQHDRRSHTAVKTQRGRIVSRSSAAWVDDPPSTSLAIGRAMPAN
jgi:hypothetical protein